MEIVTTKSALNAFLHQHRAAAKTIGFVPTMGALHQGHLALIDAAKQVANIAVCSIFVNPTQFTQAADLDNYPRPIDHDVSLLSSRGCDVLFLPSVGEMYAPGETWNLPLGELEHVLEGEFRPGHYQGVTQIVYKLFAAVQPDVAFFGQKDFQQVKVIDKMVHDLQLPVKLQMCPIVREADGLAMSSRNVHLSATERQDALALSRVLFLTRERFGTVPVQQLEADGTQLLAASPGIALEYFRICDRDTLHPARPESKTVVALVAARVGATRLIDNVLLEA